MGMAAEFLDGHAGVACDRDLAHARARPRDHAKRNIGELLLGMRRDGLRDGRFVIAVLLERGAHLLERPRTILAWVKRVPASSWLARSSCVFMVAPVAPSTLTVPINVRGVPRKTRPRRPPSRRGLDFDGVIKAGGVELAQAALQVFRGQRRSLGLGEMAGKRGQPFGGNALEGDAAHRQTLPRRNGIAGLVGGGRSGWCSGTNGWCGRADRRLAPAGAH